jgi:GT2 family glycosyltransferase
VTGGSYDLLVVDDSGRDEHRSRSKAVSDQYGARWFAHDRNRGIAAAWNTLVRSGDSPLIVLLNDDIVVRRGWLEAALYALRLNLHAGAVSLHFNFITREDAQNLVNDPNGVPPARDPFTKERKNEDHDPNGEPGKVMCPAGCAFGFSREKFDLVGGFDEVYFSMYEESDFGTALASRGFPSYCLPWPTLGHIWSATFEKAPELNASWRLGQSRARYIEKWSGHFEQTNPRYMAGCPDRLTKWLGPDGPREAVR